MPSPKRALNRPETLPWRHRAFTRLGAFLTLWTLAREIPIAFAISAPVLPAMTSFFNSAFAASVILARVRSFFLTAFGVAAAAGWSDAGLAEADCTAATNSATEANL